MQQTEETLHCQKGRGQHSHSHSLTLSSLSPSGADFLEEECQTDATDGALNLNRHHRSSRFPASELGSHVRHERREKGDGEISIDRLTKAQVQSLLRF